MAKAFILICLAVLITSGCAKQVSAPVDTIGEKIIASYDGMYEGALYTVETNDDYTYNYEIRDVSGKVLLSDRNIIRQPVIEEATENILKLSVQTGTGRATKWTVYCDVVNSRVSEAFYYVLAETQDKVVCVEFYEKYNVVIRDIFNSEKIYGGTVLEDVYTVEPIVECKKFDNKLKIVYLKGTDYTEAEVVIQID